MLHGTCAKFFPLFPLVSDERPAKIKQLVTAGSSGRGQLSVSRQLGPSQAAHHHPSQGNTTPGLAGLPDLPYVS
jgi:hypothetical protein